MKLPSIGLLPRILIAITLGILLGLFSPDIPVRLFVTFNGLFSQFLGFLVPLIILGLVTPAIVNVEAESGAGRMLLLTVCLAYVATLVSGFFSYGVCSLTLPHLIGAPVALEDISQNTSSLPYFTISIPEPLPVMTALVLAFTLGLGIASKKATALAQAAKEFESIVILTI